MRFAAINPHKMVIKRIALSAKRVGRRPIMSNGGVIPNIETKWKRVLNNKIANEDINLLMTAITDMSNAQRKYFPYSLFGDFLVIRNMHIKKIQKSNTKVMLS